MMTSNQRGATLIEFVFAFLAFIAFMYGIIGVTMWGLGGQFVQEAAHEATQVYAVMLDENAARERAMTRIGRWAYVFVEPGSIQMDFNYDSEKAHGTVTAKPRIQKLYLFNMPELKRESSCTLEYRFRHPEEFVQ